MMCLLGVGKGFHQQDDSREGRLKRSWTLVIHDEFVMKPCAPLMPVQ